MPGTRWGREQDQPFNPNDQNIKAYVLEILSTMKSIVKLEHFFKEQLQSILTQAPLPVALPLSLSPSLSHREGGALLQGAATVNPHAGAAPCRSPSLPLSRSLST